jgi:hypothetical protein
MAAKKQLTIYLAIILLALTVVLTGLPQAAAQTKVTVTFTANGFSSYTGLIFTLNGVDYNTWDLPVTLSLNSKDTISITAVPSVTGLGSNIYAFKSWTNGDGLITNTGSFSVPDQNTVVRANYEKTTPVYTTTTLTARFLAGGLTSVYGDVLQIDGVNYANSNLPSTTFQWAAGSTHTITALQPVYDNYPGIGYSFSSWTNGNGLVTASGTFTMPSSDVTVTANYVKATVQVTFSTTGLSSLNSDTLLTIDGNTYTIWDLPNTRFQWLKGSTHTITAVSSITGWDNVKHDFSSWTNGNGLVTNSGTFTTPNSDVQSIVNYVTSTTTNHLAKFATTGLSNINGDALEIDGIRYPWSNIPSLTFTWAVGETHTIKALEPVYDYYPGVGYNFSSWTNGNGLVTASGTFTMPNADVTVIANYVQSTSQVTFTTAGLSNIDSLTLLTIDGTTYNQYDLANAKFQWMKGSTHTVTAVTPITGSDNVKNDFNSWTNGNGLTTNSGAFTTPNTDVTVTAKYVISATTNHIAKFSTSGLTNINGNVLQIDGVSYLFSDLPSKTFLWEAGSTHTVTALQPVYNYDTPAKGYNFTSWTNGNGLVTSSGTFTMPSSDVIVTANYAQATVQVTFFTTGLSNLDGGQMILTVDGTSYDYWGILNLKLQWMPGTTHSISAVSLIAGWDLVTHYFRTWTNGNGLTTNTGTFTTPYADVAVALNYGLTPTITTILTVDCSSYSVNPGSAVTIMGLLTGEGSGVVGKTVTLAYYDGAIWIPIGSATTGTGGSYSYGWTIPSGIASGEYPLKASFGGDTLYLSCSASTGTPGNGGNVHVLPESWGSILVLLACFAGAFVFIRFRPKKTPVTAKLAV